MSNVFDQEVGVITLGTIVGYDRKTNTTKVRLNNTSAVKGISTPVDIPNTNTLFYNNGLFIGALPEKNTPVLVTTGESGRNYILSTLIENLNLIPNIKENELLIYANVDTKISLNKSSDIHIGSEDNRIHINTKYDYISKNFGNEYSFLQSKRHVSGVIKRDKIFNVNYDQNSKLEDDSYDQKFIVVGLDPSMTTNSLTATQNKNPPLIEDREIIYEFQYDSSISDEVFESSLYGTSKEKIKEYTFPNRRSSRADTLSLSLLSPNYLMETIKGTVVDIFGNILDLNRVPLPIGKEKTTLRSDKVEDKTQAYKKIKELERKSIAYHFELNARKDLTGQDGKIILPDINSNDDYARNRSRFFVDIDKEGQFKINVPASSEKGNIPLLVRYENYSSFGPEDNNNPNKLIYREDGLDIFLDSFASKVFPNTNHIVSRGSISILSNNVEGAPIDRITKSHIKHGTAYHDILNTCYTHTNTDFINYQNDTTTPTILVEDIPLLENVVSSTINIDGDNANAGGRSGQINFDGSIEFNIGANTVDRQSIWLDTAGGVVANFGRDKNNHSFVSSFDGNVIVQIGGFGVSGDSRFINLQNGYIGGTLDIRVLRPGFQATMFRIDQNGISILTAGRTILHSNNDIVLKSDSNITIEAENVVIQERFVNKGTGGSI